MCGIVGYVGDKDAQPILLNGLKRLEYRGYDSAGMCVLSEHSSVLFVRKLSGKVSNLEQSLQKKPLLGSLGVGHCLAPDTQVLLSDGRIKKISEIESGEGVVSVDPAKLRCGKSNKITLFRHKSPPFLYQIKTSYFTFMATGQHRIIVAAPSGEIVERKIEDLNGELVGIPRRISLLHSAKSFRLQDVFVEKHFLITSLGMNELRKARRARGYSLKEAADATGVKVEYIRRVELGQRASIEKDRLERLLKCYSISFSSDLFSAENYITNDLFLPNTTNDELMQILGYFIGDGHITERMIRFKERDKQICGIYQSLFKKVFNIGSNLRDKKGHYVFVISSRFLANWFKKNFPAIVLSMIKKGLPEFTGSLPQSQISKLLRGLFDAEGAIGMRAGQISIGMISKRVIQDVQLLLLRFGILSTYSEQKRTKRNWNDVYRISINDKESMERFEKHIGFSSFDKQKKLCLLIGLKKRFNYKYFSLPVRLDNFYSAYLKPTGIKGWRKIGLKPQKTYLTDYRLHRILEWIQKYKGHIKKKREINDLMGVVRKFTESDFVWVRPKITKVRSPYNFVYDIEAAPFSNFIGNGILQHNSRWATHGQPNQVNAHPHIDCKGEIALVHNGIIENYTTLKQELIKDGHKFISQTDTEVIVHLIEKFYLKSIKLEDAVRKALSKLEGSFAVAVVSKREPNKLVGARLGSPLVIGVGKNENFLASDVPALLDFAKDVIYLADNEIAVLTKENIKIINTKAQEVKRDAVSVVWDISQARKNGWPHFMIKEINEQPAILETMLSQRIKKNSPEIFFEELKIPLVSLEQVNKICIIACGTAYHAGMCGKYIIEELCGIPVTVDVSSEFRYRNPMVDADTLTIAISQSGETADTLAAVKEARKKKSAVLSICNVLGSSLVRESDGVIYTHAGPEIGVASTKAYTAQLGILYLLALYIARIKKSLSEEKIAKLLDVLKSCPCLQQELLKKQNLIKLIARRHSHLGSFLFLGRNINYPMALEGALKLKEISYIPAEGYAAGEMKHGPIALIDEYRAVVCIAAQSRVYEKMISNIQEIHSRQGKIIAIAAEGDEKIKSLTKEVIYIPKIAELFSPLIVSLPLQLLAYYISVKRGCDVDQPRNLAKSVTVE